MNNKPIITIVLILVAFCLLVTAASDYRSTIQNLYKHVQAEQTKETQTFRPFPPRQAQQKGLYKSSVHINFMDKEDALQTSLLRRMFKIADMNMFVSNFVLLALFDTEDLGFVKLDPVAVQDAVTAIMSYRDRNFAEGIPVYKFWPQKLINGTWEAYPVNLQEPLKYFPTFEAYAKVILEAIGLGSLWHKIEPALNELASMAKAFHIPSDTDDTCVNLALGAYLKRKSGQYPSVYSSWQQVNKDYQTLFKIITEYAYKPFDNATDFTSTAFLDTRSYFVLRDFLHNHESQRDMILPATWLMNIEQDKKKYPLVSMPFHTNNVDVSVASNTLFGLTHHYLSTKDASLYDQTVQNLILDTGKLLAWSVDTGMAIQRPDLALVYYPSLYDYYWFMARNLFLMNQHASELLPVMSQVRQLLNSALQNAGTKQLVGFLTMDAKLKHAWCDDFLGDYANKTRGEDRLFSTAMTANALLDIWTVEGKCKRQFAENTPADVKQAIDWSIRYLNDEFFKFNASMLNSFFSGSVKSFKSLPFFYPGNFYEYMNGTAIKPTNMSYISNELIGAMKGLVSEAEYQQFLKQKWFEVPVPTTFDGYNDGSFPFWSSDALTSSMTMLSMAKYVTASECK